jgi:hypothetical protein
MSLPTRPMGVRDMSAAAAGSGSARRWAWNGGGEEGSGGGKEKEKSCEGEGQNGGGGGGGGEGVVGMNRGGGDGGRGASMALGGRVCARPRARVGGKQVSSSAAVVGDACWRAREEMRRLGTREFDRGVKPVGEEGNK